METSSSQRRILLPYFLAGSGHLVSATAIRHFLHIKKPEWDLRLFEPADELNLDILAANYIRSWQFVLKRPIASKILFFLSERVFPFIVTAVNRRVAAKTAASVGSFLEEYKPDLILTTHWACGHLVQTAVRRGYYKSNVPLIVVRNDLGGAYRVQRVDCDLTVVMSKEGIEAFTSLGIPRKKLMQVNLLVRPDFLRDTSTQDNQEPIERVSPLRILLSSGGEGLGNLRKSCEMILAEAKRSNRSVSIDILAGRNQQLVEDLRSCFRNEAVTVHGYKNDVHLLMKEVDLVVGKCGANYTMETLMLGKPFFITQIGAPSEIPNMKYVVSRGCGWYARTSRQAAGLFGRIFSDASEIEEKLRNLNSLPRKSGAEQIADRVIEMVESRG